MFPHSTDPRSAPLERSRPDMPLMLMTGYTSDESLRTGAAGHAIIEKPFSASLLVRRAREAIDTAPSRPAPSA